MPEQGDAERLVILLEAKINDLEKNMAKASGVTAKAYRQMSLGSKKATTQMEADAIRSTLRINQALAATSTRIGELSRSFSAGAIAPIAGLLTLTAAINGTKAALDRFGDIADKSAAAGVDPEFFQGLAYAAKLSGVEIDGVSSALETFAKNSGLAAEGKGRMVTALQVLNPELLKNIQAATTQEQRVKLVADAIKNAKDQAQAAAIATAAFGDSGVKLVAVFSEGGDAIDRTIAKAKEMGIVVDREVIERADELGDKFDTVATIIDTRLKSALVNLAPQLIWLEERVIDILNTLQDVQDLAQHPGDIVDVLAAGSHANAELARFKQDMQREMGESDLAKALGTGNQPSGILGTMMGYDTGAANDLGNGPEQRVLERWFGVRLSGASAIPGMPTGGFSDAVLNPLVKTTKAAHDATYAIGTTSNAVTQLSQNWQKAEDMAEGFTSTLVNGLTSTGDLLGSLIDATRQLGNELIQMAANQAIKSLFNTLSGGLLGGFGSVAGGAAIPMGGFIPGLTGPKLFASGTPNTGGQRGEPMGVVHGQEAVIPLPSGGKVPVQLQQGAAGAHGVEVTFHMSVGSDGNVMPGIDSVVQKGIETYNKVLDARFGAAVRAAVTDRHRTGGFIR